ncbi:unnamed protein product [Gemmataceae bacterium]|nr:unnamed protein product [Gemmataceae bacterium]VTT99983.1 unnamed protein product [Gemmataceae bacterium]
MPRSRHLSALLVGVLSVSATSCRHNNCASRSGTLTSNQPQQRGEPPCMLTSGSGARLSEGCYDAITGQPVPCPPSNSPPGGMVLPAPTYPPPAGVAPRPDELPFPAPSDNIPRPGVPFAPPSAAPGIEGAALTPKAGATPVRANPKQ